MSIKFYMPDYKSRILFIVLVLGSVIACTTAPKKANTPVVFHPDLTKVRSSLGVAAGPRSDAAALGSAAEAIWELCRNVHPVRSPLDLVFDNNKDGKIDEDELRVARGFFFGPSFLNLGRVDPKLTSALAVPPRMVLSADDLKVWDRYLFGQAEKLLVPHKISNPFERKLAEGDPAQLTQKAIRDAVERASLGAAESFLFFPQNAPAGPAVPILAIPRGPVKTELQELANTSLSGTVTDEECKTAEDDLNGPPHPAKSAFARAIDFEGTGYVDLVDLNEARRAASLPSARLTRRPAASYPVVTKADALLSITIDGVVSEDDLATVATALVSGVNVPSKILATFDTNGDGKLDQGELRRALEAFRPHLVDHASGLDAALDTKHTGFITADEVGIGAGFTLKGQILSIDMRVKAVRDASRKQGPAQGTMPTVAAPAVQRKINLTGKRLAVVGLVNSTKTIDQDGINGTLTFLESSFVNMGSVTIVDRSDINKVMDELELQANSAVSDEATAVKVGKLSGADVIATGTLSSVGGKYYIEVKLVSVERGEILSSSIAEAANPDGFLAMCQQAVSKLF